MWHNHRRRFSSGSDWCLTWSNTMPCTSFQWVPGPLSLCAASGRRSHNLDWFYNSSPQDIPVPVGCILFPFFLSCVRCQCTTLSFRQSKLPFFFTKLSAEAHPFSYHTTFHGLAPQRHISSCPFSVFARSCSLRHSSMPISRLLLGLICYVWSLLGSQVCLFSSSRDLDCHHTPISTMTVISPQDTIIQLAPHSVPILHCWLMLFRMVCPGWRSPPFGLWWTLFCLLLSASLTTPFWPHDTRVSGDWPSPRVLYSLSVFVSY